MSLEIEPSISESELTYRLKSLAKILREYYKFEGDLDSLWRVTRPDAIGIKEETVDFFIHLFATNNYCPEQTNLINILQMVQEINRRFLMMVSTTVEANVNLKTDDECLSFHSSLGAIIDDAFQRQFPMSGISKVAICKTYKDSVVPILAFGNQKWYVSRIIAKSFLNL